MKFLYKLPISKVIQHIVREGVCSTNSFHVGKHCGDHPYPHRLQTSDSHVLFPTLSFVEIYYTSEIDLNKQQKQDIRLHK